MPKTSGLVFFFFSSTELCCDSLDVRVKARWTGTNPKSLYGYKKTDVCMKPILIMPKSTDQTIRLATVN